MKFTYPAIFTPIGVEGYEIHYPDFPSVRTQGRDFNEAAYKATDVLKIWADYVTNQGVQLPKASVPYNGELNVGQFIKYIEVDTVD